MSLMTKGVRRSVALGACGLLVGVLASCGVTRGDDSSDLLMIIPNSPGGGYDLTGRAAVRCWRTTTSPAATFTVENVIGAGGASR